VVLLLIAAVVVGLPTAGLTVLIVALVSRSRGKPKTAGYLVKLGLLVFAAFPVTVLLLGLLMALFLG
jgi:hypothetical protein